MNKVAAAEWQFDGLVGPTHNYAGLSYGNIASGHNAGAVSNPRLAALQGLQKMRYVQGLGINQAFIPPRKRPLISELQRLGFDGGINAALRRARQEAPHLLASIFSSSYMWAANAATVGPSADSADGKMHLTPANLVTNYHRSLEAMDTYILLKRIFSDETYFAVHAPLPGTTAMADEGAANHMRLVGHSHGDPGLQIFVCGSGVDIAQNPQKFPARQKLEAYQAIARLHQLDPDRSFFVQQNPAAIDAGVFHNDVIAMNTTRLMVVHEKAFLNQPHVLEMLHKAANPAMHWQAIEISDQELPIKEAVQSYFFNAQMLQLPDGGIVIVAPKECEENPFAHAALTRLAAGNAVAAIHYLDVRESMRNGGGPACLRLRVVLTDAEAKAMHQGIVLTDEKYDLLVRWVEKHYRDRLSLDDLCDPALIQELDEAYAALEQIIEMPGLYQSV